MIRNYLIANYDPEVTMATVRFVTHPETTIEL